jgi:TM2 domain-containing membrane protein YozV
MDYKDVLYTLKGISQEEFSFLIKVMEGMSEDEGRKFIAFYSGKRQVPSEMLLFTLLGFIGVSGVQRFVVGQIGMGILYLITAGLCFVGTIVDAINYRSITLDYNQRAAFECARMIRYS